MLDPSILSEFDVCKLDADGFRCLENVDCWILPPDTNVCVLVTDVEDELV